MKALAEKVLRKIEALKGDKDFKIDTRFSSSGSVYIKLISQDKIVELRIADHKITSKDIQYELSDNHSGRAKWSYPTSQWELCVKAMVGEFN